MEKDFDDYVVKRCEKALKCSNGPLGDCNGKKRSSYLEQAMELQKTSEKICYCKGCGDTMAIMSKVEKVQHI